MSRWQSHHEGSYGWHGQWRLGRLQLGFHVYKHTYPTTSDRWVLQPFVILDRREST